MNTRRAFTLVEIMIVVLIIGLLLSIAVPQWIRARENSQAKSCITTLKKMGDAKDIWAQENNIPTGGAATMADIWPDYLRGSAPPSCPSSGAYTVNPVGSDPECSSLGGLYPHVL